MRQPEVADFSRRPILKRGVILPCYTCEMAHPIGRHYPPTCEACGGEVETDGSGWWDALCFDCGEQVTNGAAERAL
jgi:hypothetical protein